MNDDDLTFLSLYFKEDDRAPYEGEAGFVKVEPPHEKVKHLGWDIAEPDRIFHGYAVGNDRFFLILTSHVGHSVTYTFNRTAGIENQRFHFKNLSPSMNVLRSEYR